jgi:hypothetical protein
MLESTKTASLTPKQLVDSGKILFMAFLLLADKVLQSYTRKFRAPALTCALDDRRVYELSSRKFPKQKMHSGIIFPYFCFV